MPFPTQSQLNSNDIESLIDAAESNIRQLKLQIQDLTHALQKERSTLARLWFMVTPIGKVPTEILVEIFMHSVQANREVASSHPNFPSPCTRQALLLSRVCPHWRQIINNTPRLWNSGAIDVQLARIHTSTAGYMFGLKTLLERSGSLPISVSLAQDSGELVAFPEVLTQVTETVIQTMVPTTHRWKYLKLDAFSFPRLVALTEGTFDALQSLDIVYEAYMYTQHIRTFFPAPQLRRLALWIRDGPPDLLLLPWAQLTHLRLRYTSLSVSAEFDTSEWDFGLLEDPPKTTLLFLETLKVLFDAGDEDIGRVEPFFEPLVLPVLRTLDLTFDPSGVVWSAHTFSAFQCHSPHIAHISLTNCPINSGELITLLRLAPAVTTLKLQYCMECIDDEFLVVMTWDGEDNVEPLAPQLRQLDWEAVGDRFSEQHLEAAIRSRWWINDATGRSVRRLEKVSVRGYGGDSMSEDLIERMKDFTIVPLQSGFLPMINRKGGKTPLALNPVVTFQLFGNKEMIDFQTRLGTGAYKPP
ncbi:hypothetical protein B0H19DRAFT_1225473 [Mycena capillaripes]|nr:hypothetical protein B0H19DRAFT_1225473 [Mycena capillaripes]